MTYSVPAGVLAVNTTFYVRARVKDVAGLVSDWATITSFTTKAELRLRQYPDRHHADQRPD